jgi:hypothetical protein
MSVNVTPEKVTVLRTGAEGIDLAGNTLIKLSLQLPAPASISYFIADPEIRDKHQALEPPKKAKLKIKQTFIANREDLFVSARLSYVDRDISTGEQYEDEGKQTVKFQTSDTGWQSYLLLPRQEIEPPIWVIMSNNAAVSVSNDLEFQNLAFDNYDAAQEFTAWLKHYRAPMIGSHALFAGDIAGVGQPIEFDRLQVQRLHPETPQVPAPSC